MLYNIKINLDCINLCCIFVAICINFNIDYFEFMEKIINFGFKMGASEIIFKNDGCQLVFTRAIDAREVSALCTLLGNHYRDCDIRVSRALIDREELLITVSPIIPK